MPTSLREHAIALAEGGFCVFPLRPGEKIPAVKWRKWSTVDIGPVSHMWADNAWNIGIDTGKSGLLVIDVDNKRGKTGSDSLSELEILHGDLPPTPIARTPSGGYHYYFKTGQKVKNSAGRLGEGLDVRAEGGFVVAPGSQTEAGAYEWLTRDIQVADAPEWLLGLCEAHVERPETGEVVGNVDESFAIRRAVAYLKESAPPAIEGDSGDLTTFKVACEIKDMGLSAEETLLLMEAHYNPRCTPPWDAAELSMKVRSAYKSGQNAAGASSPQADFVPIDPESVSVPTPEAKEIEDKNPMRAYRVGDQELVNIPPRDWIIPGRLIAQNVTLTIAPGGTGKSLFAILEALAVATGKNLTGVEPAKSGPVFIYNLEDPLDELYRRLVATCMLNDLPVKETLDNVYVQSGIDRPLFLAGNDGSTQRLGRDCRRLEEFIGDMGFVAVCIDPLVRAHRLSENDNMAVDFLMDALARIARRTQTAISVVHHTAKNRTNEQLAGNIDYSRGASALINAARIAHTLVPMDTKTAERFHLDGATRVSFLRLDEGKINLSAQTARVLWYRKCGVTLPNGDNVGGLVAADLTEFELDNDAREEGERIELTMCVADFVMHETKSMANVASYLQASEPHLYGGVHKTTMKRRIEAALGGGGAVVEGWRYRVIFENKGNTHNWIQPTKEEDDE